MCREAGLYDHDKGERVDDNVYLSFGAVVVSLGRANLIVVMMELFEP
jgi:hypothetical protein